MAYPEDYDELTGLDLGECALFSHTLHDGIVDTAYEVEMDATYCVYANYGSAEPKVSIIDPSNDEYLIEEATGEFKDNIAMWKFCIDIPKNGYPGDGDTYWGEKSAILKVWSDDSPLAFKKHVGIILKACTTAEMCDTMEKVVGALEEIKVSEAGQNTVLKTLSNGWKVIA